MKKMNLGQVLTGERLVKTKHEFQFNKPSTSPITMCSVEYDKAQLDKMMNAVERNFYFEFDIDDLPVRGFVGQVEETSVLPHKHNIYLYNHQVFEFLVNGNEIVAVNFSHGTQQPILLSDLPESEIQRIDYTYEVSWKQTGLPVSMRETLSQGGLLPLRMEIHWLSIFNSLFLVGLLLAFNAAAIGHTLRRDLSQTEDTDDMALSSGWKSVRSDVFRPPKRRSLLASIVGVGFQLTCLAVGLLLLMSLEAFETHRHSNAVSAVIVLYALTSGLGGIISGTFYRQMNGKRWMFNGIQTAFLYVGPVSVLWALISITAALYGSTRAPPVGTAFLLIALWLFIGLPLTLGGSAMAHRWTSIFTPPCRPRNIPREIPPRRWFAMTPVQLSIGSILSFSAIAVELFYIYSSVFCRHPYSLYHVLLLAFCVLLLVAASSSVALTYCRLASEDHRWWWPSALNPASASILLGFYSIYFYLRHCRFGGEGMSGFLQTLLYFGQCVTVGYAVALMLASVGFIASRYFAIFVYSRLKAD